MNIENYGWYFIIPGAVLALIGILWLIVAGFKTRWYWGLGMFLVLPALLFIGRRFKRARAPLLVILLGAAVVATPAAVNRYQLYFLDLGPRDKMVDGERHVTLTGWDQEDYSIVRLMPDVVVLQMANPD